MGGRVEGGGGGGKRGGGGGDHSSHQLAYCREDCSG